MNKFGRSSAKRNELRTSNINSSSYCRQTINEHQHSYLQRSSRRSSANNRFIANRCMISKEFNFQARSLERKKARHPDNEYRELLKNELFDLSPLKSSHQGLLSECDDNIKLNYYEIQPRYKRKYFDMNTGASPIQEKDKLTRTPSSLRSPSPKERYIHQYSSRCLSYCHKKQATHNASEKPSISTTPLDHGTQFKIKQIDHEGRRLRHKLNFGRPQLISKEDQDRNRHADNFRNIINGQKDTNRNAQQQEEMVPAISARLRPYRVLSAPGIVDDFYSSILDWNHHTNMIGIALRNEMFTYNIHTECKANLTVANHSVITSVKFSPTGDNVAFGTDQNVLCLYDLHKQRQWMKIATNDMSHIGVLEWSTHLSNSCVVVASKVSNHINICDLRTNVVNNIYRNVKKIQSPTKCVSLRWSPDLHKFAVGGRDRCVSIFDIRFLKHRIFKLKYHSSSIRAIDWSPHHYNVLVSGGGAVDKKICVWNLNHTTNNRCKSSSFVNTSCITIKKPLKCIRAQSQICNLIWNPFNEHQVLSTHGFAHDSKDINIWDFQQLYWRSAKNMNVNTNENQAASKHALYRTSTNGHKTRALYVALSANKKNIVTASSDEKLMFWNVFNQQDEKLCKLHNPRQCSPCDFRPNIR